MSSSKLLWAPPLGAANDISLLYGAVSRKRLGNAMLTGSADLPKTKPNAAKHRAQEIGLQLNLNFGERCFKSRILAGIVRLRNAIK